MILIHKLFKEPSLFFLKMTLEDYLAHKFEILGLQVKKKLVQACMNFEGANGEETKSLRNICSKLAIYYTLIGNKKKAEENQALAEQYI